MSRNICVKISDEVYSVLRDLARTYGSQKNAIEQAVIYLKEKRDYDTLNREDIYRLQLLKEFNFTLINKKEFLYLIEGDKHKIICDCAGLMQLQGLSEKAVKGLSTNELISKLDLLFVKILSWCDKIYKKASLLDKSADLIIFVHSNNRSYSEFMSSYLMQIYERLGYQVLNNSIDETYFTTTIKKA